MKKSKGYKRKHTNHILRKNPRKRGMAPLGRSILQKYNVGDYVDIIIDPGVQKSQPHFRFHGKTGIVKDFRGKAIIISVKIGNKEKTLITRKDHIRLSRCNAS